MFPFSQEEIEQACIDLLKINEFKDGYLRPLVYLGSEAMGLGALNNTVHVAIACWKWGAYLVMKELNTEFDVKLAPLTAVM